jgi:hypothetical protein
LKVPQLTDTTREFNQTAYNKRLEDQEDNGIGYTAYRRRVQEEETTGTKGQETEGGSRQQKQEERSIGQRRRQESKRPVE